jgi:hypothetical protein
MKRIILALSLASCALAGCGIGDSVNDKIAVAGQKVLDRVIPAEFTSFSIRLGDLGSSEYCRATVTKAHRKDWDTTDGALETLAPRDWTGTVELKAEKRDGHWVITDSDADPESIDAATFEAQVTGCLERFRTQLADGRKWEKKHDEETAHNLKSWNDAESSGVTAPKPQLDTKS